MSEVKIYHNPRCSKSRKTLDLLAQNGVKVEIIKYLESPPNKNQIKELLLMLNMSVEDLMRKGEEDYKKNIKDQLLTDQQKIDLMIRFPKIIERPIVVNNGKAVIGRPPENVLDII